MAAAIVELDALADAVRTAAQDDRLLLVRRIGLAIGAAVEAGLVGRIHIGRQAFELGRACVDALVDRAHAQCAARGAHGVFFDAAKFGEARIRKAHRLQPVHVGFGLRHAVRAHLRLSVDQALQLFEEPRIVGTGRVDLVVGHAVAQRLRDDEQAVRRRPAQRGTDRVLVVAFAHAGHDDFVEPRQPRFHRAQRLLQGLLEGAADGHGLADRFHRRAEQLFGAGEFLEGEARDFRHHIIDGRLEACRA